MGPEIKKIVSDGVKSSPCGDAGGLYFAYAVPSAALALMAISFYVFIPKYYAESGAITVGGLGFAVLLTRLWDAAIDPLVGYLSDRTYSTQGRRKPWLKLSVIPLGLSFVLLFAAKGLPNQFHLTSFIALSSLFFFFWTTYSIPYEALGQDLVVDYDRRNTLFSFRDGALVCGTILAVIVPAIVEVRFSELSSIRRWVAVATIYWALLIASTVICCRTVKTEPASKLKRDAGFLTSYRQSLQNEHFRQLLIAYLVSALGAAMPATLFLFYIESVLESRHGPLFLVLYFVVAVAALPLWTKVASKWDKKRTWIAALLVNAGGFLGVSFLSAGDELAYAILISLSAVGYGATLAIPSSIQADIIDAEELRTGQRKEGQFLGIWSLAKKTSAALGAGFALWLLGYFGFDATSKFQTPTALSLLKILYCFIPSCCSLLAIFFLRDFSLNRHAHQTIRSEIERRREAPLHG
jgi:GPH family glycoside/pentoside/hexuronide:cation symporter